MERRHHLGGDGGDEYWKAEAARWRAAAGQLPGAHAQAQWFLRENVALRVRVVELHGQVTGLTERIAMLARLTLVAMTIPRQIPAAGWLARHSITLLRISMGATIFGFGFLKYFPGLSAAEDLVLATTRALTFGVVPDRTAMVLLATVECVLGLFLMIGRGLRVIRYLLIIWAVGILSPALLLSGRLFMGPWHGPTLEGQYVLKDVILLTASLVIATHCFAARPSRGVKNAATEPIPGADRNNRGRGVAGRQGQDAAASSELRP